MEQLIAQKMLHLLEKVEILEKSFYKINERDNFNVFDL